MSKQDRQGVRTASDLERKYEFGAIKTQGEQANNQNYQMSMLNQAFSQALASVNAKIASMEISVQQANAKIASLEESLSEADAAITDLADQMSQQEALWQNSYPIGSIYISVDSTNPSELLGFGVWEQIKDTFLLSAGDKYEGGAVGGDAEHTLTIDEMPKHSHKFAYGVTGATASTTMLVIPGDSFESGSAEWRTTTQDFIVESGGDVAHNNMPPYLAVYVWKRTE